MSVKILTLFVAKIVNVKIVLDHLGRTILVIFQLAFSSYYPFLFFIGVFANPDFGKVPIILATIISLSIVALISMNVLLSRIYVNKNVPICGDLTDVIAGQVIFS